MQVFWDRCVCSVTHIQNALHIDDFHWHNSFHPTRTTFPLTPDQQWNRTEVIPCNSMIVGFVCVRLPRDRLTKTSKAWNASDSRRISHSWTNPALGTCMEATIQVLASANDWLTILEPGLDLTRRLKKGLWARWRSGLRLSGAEFITKLKSADGVKRTLTLPAVTSKLFGFGTGIDPNRSVWENKKESLVDECPKWRRNIEKKWTRPLSWNHRWWVRTPAESLLETSTTR
jgi:hypothetical protein